MNDKLKEIDRLCDALLVEDDGEPDDIANRYARRIKELVAELDKQDWECTLAAANESAYRVALDKFREIDTTNMRDSVAMNYLRWIIDESKTVIATADRNKTVR